MGGIFIGKFTYKEEVNNWKWDIPEKYNIGYDIVDKHAEGKNKDKIALFWEDSKGNSKKFTFGEMKILSNQFGNVLKNLGFKKGDRFLIRLPIDIYITIIVTSISRICWYNDVRFR